MKRNFNLEIGLRLFLAGLCVWLGVTSGYDITGAILGAIVMRLPGFKFNRRVLAEGVTLSDEDEEKLANAIKDKVKSLVDPLRQALEVQGLALQKLQGGTYSHAAGSPLSTIIQSKKKDFENLLSGNARAVKLTIPASVMKTLASRASVNDSTAGLRLGEVGQLATPTLALRALFRSVEVGENSGGFVKYLDQSLVTRGAAPRAEGTQKPESAIEWSERAIPIQTIADTIPITKQLLQDFTQLADDIERFLQTNLSLKIDQQLWDGDGNTPNLKGLYTSATVYAGYTGPAIESANLFDLIEILRAEMIASTGGKYIPDTVVVNPIDLVALKLTKSSLDTYVITSLSGYRIIESAQTDPGTMLIGDSRFATLYTLGGVTVELGYIDKFFQENKVLLLVEERLALLVREVDRDAFLKVTDIAAALANLGNPGS